MKAAFVLQTKEKFSSTLERLTRSKKMFTGLQGLRQGKGPGDGLMAVAHGTTPPGPINLILMVSMGLNVPFTRKALEKMQNGEQASVMTLEYSSNMFAASQPVQLTTESPKPPWTP